MLTIDQETDENKERLKEFTDKIKHKFDASSTILIKITTLFNPHHLIDIDQEDSEFVEKYNKLISDESIKQVEEVTSDSYDPYLRMEISLPRGGDTTPIAAHVKRRATTTNDQPIGTAHANPLIDTRQYEVEFVDGYSEALSVNILAENLIAQVDQEGLKHQLT